MVIAYWSELPMIFLPVFFPVRKFTGYSRTNLSYWILPVAQNPSPLIYTSVSEALSANLLQTITMKQYLPYRQVCWPVKTLSNTLIRTLWNIQIFHWMRRNVRAKISVMFSSRQIMTNSAAGRNWPKFSVSQLMKGSTALRHISSHCLQAGPIPYMVRNPWCVFVQNLAIWYLPVSLFRFWKKQGWLFQ